MKNVFRVSLLVFAVLFTGIISANANSFHMEITKEVTKTIKIQFSKKFKNAIEKKEMMRVTANQIRIPYNFLTAERFKELKDNDELSKYDMVIW